MVSHSGIFQETFHFNIFSNLLIFFGISLASPDCGRDKTPHNDHADESPVAVSQRRTVTNSHTPALTLSRGGGVSRQTPLFYYTIYYTSAINAGALIKASGLIGGTTSIKEKRPQTGRSCRCQPQPRGVRRLVGGWPRVRVSAGMCVPSVLRRGSERGCVWDEERGLGSASKPPRRRRQQQQRPGMQLCEEKGDEEKWTAAFWGWGGGVNRRSLCVPPRKICDQLSESVSVGAIMETLWVGAQERMHEEQLWGGRGAGGGGGGGRSAVEDLSSAECV